MVQRSGSAGTLHGQTVVVCRSADQSAELTAAVEAAGGIAVVMPLIEIRPPDDGGAALRLAMGDLERFDWVAFTSANAVAAAQGVRPLQTWPETLRLAAVGGMTSRAIAAVGGTVQLRPTSATAADLAASFDPSPPTLKVLAPLGHLASDDLALGLRLHGHEVEVVEAYRSVEPDVSESVVSQASQAGAVFLTSPSIARRYWDLIGPGPEQIAVTMGPRTHAEAQRLGFPNLYQADSADSTGLVSALCRAVELLP